jgi:putative DNA methylase
MAILEHIDHAQVYGKHTQMYLQHKFWARKPHNIVRKYIDSYSREGEIVLDPFCGSGVVASEAIKSGRKTVAIDLSPIALFVTRMTILPINLDEVEKAFADFEKNVKPKIYELYRIKCPRCGKRKAITKSLIISFVVECPSCKKNIVMSKAKHAEGKKQMVYKCPFCENKFNYATLDLKDEAFTELRFKCDSCGARETIQDPPSEMIRKEPSEVSYWYPNLKLSYPSGKRFITSRRMKTVPDLFTKTNLQALSILYHFVEAINDASTRDFMKFVFSSTLHLTSRLIMLKRGTEAGWNVPEFLVASFHPEYNVWDRFKNRYQTILKGKKQSSQEITHYQEARDFSELKDNANILVANRSAQDLSIIPDNAIDYIFTDPPYGGSIQFFELEFLPLAWLNGEENDVRFSLDRWKEEITINRSQDKDFDYYHNQLHTAFREMHRVLKPKRYMTVTFHNTEIEIYNSIIRAAMFAGFELEKIIYQPTEHISSKAGFHPYTSAVGDFYLRFQKPENPLVPTDEREMDEIRAERIILESIKKILAERGEPSTFTDILKGQSFIYRELKAHGYLFFGANPENVTRILKKNEGTEFVFIEGEGWWFRNPTQYHLSIPLNDRVEEAVLQILRRKVASFDDVLQEIYFNFRNALTPSKANVGKLLAEYGERTSDNRWRLKPQVKLHERAHSEMIGFLAQMGKKAGYSIWIGTREQTDTFEGKALAEFCDFKELYLSGIDQNDIAQYISQIDILWIKDERIAFAFEVEYTTLITDAFMRCSNIPEVHNPRRIIVIPKERDQLMFRKLNSNLLRESVEKQGWKLIFFEDLLKLHNETEVNKALSPETILSIMRTPTEQRDKQLTIESFASKDSDT